MFGSYRDSIKIIQELIEEIHLHSDGRYTERAEKETQLLEIVISRLLKAEANDIKNFENHTN
ncbi:MAG: hypothetical protein BWY21_00317 [Parcubacteria group bacterium ADurb.Bin216]|nr:MAG: hypothetical protein BWY21_00317 [Parcubacteria group bacterium ADurb.Bin216]